MGSSGQREAGWQWGLQEAAEATESDGGPGSSWGSGGVNDRPQESAAIKALRRHFIAP